MFYGTLLRIVSQAFVGRRDAGLREPSSHARRAVVQGQESFSGGEGDYSDSFMRWVAVNPNEGFSDLPTYGLASLCTHCSRVTG